jgi:hypothetical protein
MTDYNTIQKSIERVLTSLNDDVNYLETLKADPLIIAAIREDIKNLNEASELLWQYKELES